MKTEILIVLISISTFSPAPTYAQNVKRQTDKHIVHQQERMVHKQWDRKKFTPTKGFLGLNYQYWLTWAWHPNYPKKDLRPLSGSGPQTQRLLMVAAMKNTEEAYKKHTDTLKNTAITETYNYAGLLSGTDPIWQLYYKQEFAPLLNIDNLKALEGAQDDIREYLTKTETLKWFVEEAKALNERLQSARTTDMDRGSRITAYHRLLMESRKLLEIWGAKKTRARLYLDIGQQRDKLNDQENYKLEKPLRSDIQIANDVLSRSKL